MCEVAPGVYTGPRMTAGVRQRVWDVLTDWFEPAPDRSILMTWPDESLPGGQDFRALGTPRHSLVEYGGVYLARRDPPADLVACAEGQDIGAPLAAVETTALVVDCETTGLDSDAEVIWIAAISLDGEMKLDLRARPLGLVDPKAARVHRLQASELQRAEPFQRVFGQVQAVLAGHRLFAWNAAFDARLLAQTCARNGITPPELEWSCLLELYEAWRGLRCQLATACQLEKVTPAPTHGAVDDVRAALGLLRKMAGLPPLAPATDP